MLNSQNFITDQLRMETIHFFLQHSVFVII